MSKTLFEDFKCFNDVLKNGMDIIIIVNETGKIVYANKKALETYGYSYEEILSLTVFQLRGNKKSKLIQNQIKDAIEKGIEFQTIHYKKDGSKFPVEVKLAFLNEESKNEVISIIRDITTRIKKDKENIFLATTLDNSSDAIVTLSKNRKIAYWSKGAKKLFFYVDAQVIGESIESALKFEDEANVIKKINAVYKGKSIENLGIKIITKEGEFTDALISVYPVYDDDLDIIGVTSIFKDNSQMKMLVNEINECKGKIKETDESLIEKNKKLEIAIKEADNANLAKDQFLANMSHEIRTPLNGIFGTINLLKVTSDKDEQNKYLKMLEESYHTLSNTINEILDISKIESGKFQIRMEEFNLKETIINIYNNLVVTANQKGLEVRFYLDSSIEFHVISDEQRLKQILTNIISNAIKFTDMGYVSFRIKSIHREKDREKIQFEIEDSGIGIEESFKDKIFEKFNQGDISTKKRFVGTGLGLSICNQLATLMNGNITYESNVGIGSVFYYTCDFEMQKSKEVDISEIQILDELSSNNYVEGDKVILIVEDNFINERVLYNLLKRKGYQCISANNGKNALAILEITKVDLILMDIQMPELNGFETTDAIRKIEENDKRIPIVAMTAYAMSEDKEKCLKSGMDNYISKPFDIEELYGIIDEYL